MGAADTLIGSLTVTEMLMYTAELKRPMTEHISKKREAVSALLEDLGLTTCRDTLIGDSMHRGISGGQVGLQCTHVTSVCNWFFFKKKLTCTAGRGLTRTVWNSFVCCPFCFPVCLEERDTLPSCVASHV